MTSATASPDPTALIVGERVKICAVRDADFATWASWFNSAHITSFLDHGEFPNSESDQRQFFATARANGRFIGMVRSIATDRLLGVISLSEINRAKRSAQLALVVPIRCETAPLAALEAVALVTEHALTRMGLMRLWAGQAHPGTARWAKRMELIGWISEGVARHAFVHGDTTSDAVWTSALKSDVERLRLRRNGSLWCGTERMQKMLRYREFAEARPAVELVAEAVRAVGDERWRLLERVEEKCSGEPGL